MKYKVLSLFVIFSALIFSGCAKKQEKTDALDKILKRDKLIVGVKHDTKPFGYMDGGKLVGYDIDLAKLIAESLLGDENKVEYIQVTPSNRILLLNSNKIDMIIATMTITEQRKQVVDFSIPYFWAGQAVMVPQDSNIKSMFDLNGKKVIVIFGTTAEKNLRLFAPDAKVVGFKTYTSGYNALKESDADAITSDDTILRGFAMDDKSVKLLPKRYSKEPYAIAFKKNEESQRLLNKVNFIINNLSQSGKLNRLKSKWIND